MENKKSQIVFDVELDENNVPEKMDWKSTDNNEGGNCHASLISIWDGKTKNTLKNSASVPGNTAISNCIRNPLS